jgi:acyl-CoA synthetase (AMP-forming)/AMP-acid ligase II
MREPMALPGEQHWLPQRLRSWGDRPALIWRGQSWSYDQLSTAVADWRGELARRSVVPGDTLAICGDYSPRLCALLIAALLNRNIIVPLASATAHRWDDLMDTAQVRFAVEFDRDDVPRFAELRRSVTHPFLRQLARRGSAGLVLFSSGSTGESKASVLDFDRLLTKFQPDRPGYCTLVFLLLDHIGGINSLFHVLCHGGTIVTIGERDPEAVCAAIAAHRVQLLPTTPTFLRMLLIADAIPRHDMTSLEIVTYGTEPMPASTLAAIREALPHVRFKQTYGLSELGILPTRSRDSGSLWLKLGNTGFEHRIVDGILWLRSQTAMLGYLNAPSPFDAEGWFNTQDVVEVDGEYIRILGRKSELINVGGEKVHPTEIENVLLQLDNVKDVTVSGRANPVTGEVVAAKVTPVEPEDPDAFRQRLRRFCRARLEPYKIPAVIEIVQQDHHGARFKKARKELVQC